MKLEDKRLEQTAHIIAAAVVLGALRTFEVLPS